MRACEQWIANDFLVRHGHQPGPHCGHDPADCPPINPTEEAA